MKKVLIIINENNKEKFILRDIAQAFRKLSFFVYEMKVCNINIEIANKISPHLIYIFWSKNSNFEALENFTENLSCKPDFIHCCEYIDDIPQKYFKRKYHYIFYPFALNKKNRYIPSVNPDNYQNTFQSCSYNITFAGNPAFKNREFILSELIKHFGKINIFCRSFDFYKSIDDMQNYKFLDDFELMQFKKSYRGYAQSQSELGKIFASTKINIDLKSDRVKGINQRVLEITSTGAFLIAPRSTELSEWFMSGMELETFDDVYDLVDKIDFYLKNLDIAKKIGLYGKTNTENNFSVYDKLRDMLKEIYGKNYSYRR